MNCKAHQIFEELVSLENEYQQKSKELKDQLCYRSSDNILAPSIAKICCEDDKYFVKLMDINGVYHPDTLKKVIEWSDELLKGID